MVSCKSIATGAAAAMFAVAGCGEAPGAGKPAPESSPKPGVVQGEQAPMSPSDAPALGGCAASTEIEFRELNDFYLARNVGEVCVVVFNQIQAQIQTLLR